jgi:hypothetical protein
MSARAAVTINRPREEGERLERKLKQRPAQPLDEQELEEVGVR